MADLHEPISKEEEDYILPEDSPSIVETQLSQKRIFRELHFFWALQSQDWNASVQLELDTEIVATIANIEVDHWRTIAVFYPSTSALHLYIPAVWWNELPFEET